MGKKRRLVVHGDGNQEEVIEVRATRVNDDSVGIYINDCPIAWIEIMDGDKIRLALPSGVDTDLGLDLDDQHRVIPEKE